MQIILVAALSMETIATTGAEQQRGSDPREFRKYVGETKTMCGHVMTYDYPGKDGSGDCSLRLDIGGPYWKPVFYILIKPDARPIPAAESYLAQEACATGIVENDRKHVPFIAVTGGSGLEIKDRAPTSPFGEGAARTCEMGMVGPKLKKEVKPNYPVDEFRRRAAVKNFANERVALQAVIAEDGGVRACRTVYAMSASFAHAAEAALKQWRFTPARRNGAAVAVVVQVEMTFAFH
jgi:hypothetical protein